MHDVKILIADGDENIRNIIKRSVDAQGFLADEASNGIVALKMFKRNKYDLIVIDANTPELDGYHVCRQIRKTSGVPIIVISSSSQEKRVLSFFDIGIDDYVVKPFSCSELTARIKVFLRRTINLKNIPPRIIAFNEISIDCISRTVYIQDKEIQLTPKEYELLLYLSKNPNKALSREVLLNQVWGMDFFGSDRTVDTHIKTLRDNIKPYHHYITTIWGYGYKLEG